MSISNSSSYESALETVSVHSNRNPFLCKGFNFIWPSNIIGNRTQEIATQTEGSREVIESINWWKKNIKSVSIVMGLVVLLFVVLFSIKSVQTSSPFDDSTGLQRIKMEISVKIESSSQPQIQTSTPAESIRIARTIRTESTSHPQFQTSTPSESFQIARSVRTRSETIQTDEHSQKK